MVCDSQQIACYLSYCTDLINHLIKCVCYLPAYVGFMVTKTAQEGLRGRVGVPSKAKRERPACREEGEKREKEGEKRV